MLENKIFEVRDRMTFVSVLAIAVTSRDKEERSHIMMAGYGLTLEPTIALVRLDSFWGHTDPYAWNDRTMQTAHLHIRKNFHRLQSCAVVDVEYILGETKQPKVSEISGD